MNQDPVKSDLNSESETDEWVLVANELEESTDLTSSFVDLQEDGSQSDSNVPLSGLSPPQSDSSVPQSSVPQSVSNVDGETSETPSQIVLVPKQEREFSVEPSVTRIETSTKPKTYAEVLRKANRTKPNWTVRTAGKTRVKRKKGRSQPQNEVSKAEKKTQRRGSCGQQFQGDSPVTPSGTLTLCV